MISPFFQILLVGEDSTATQAQSVSEMLNDGAAGSFRVVRAPSLQQALLLVSSSNFDALVLDTNAADGLGLVGVISELSRGQVLSVIALVSQKDEALKKQILQAGAADCLVKETLNAGLLQSALRYAVELKRAQAALRHYERRFRELFEDAKDVIFTLDLDGKITSVNKAGEDVIGWSREAIIGKNIKTFVAPEHFALCSQLLQRITGEDPVQEFEISLLHHNGRRVLLDTSARLLQDKDRAEIQGIARDVTDRRNVEKMLRQAQKLEALGRLSGGLAHDFNNQLCVITAHAELLAERLDPSHPAAKSVAQIRKAADSAAALTRQLLAFSRKQIIHPRILDLNTIVAETQKLFGRLIGEHIEFSTALDPALGRTRVDPVLVEQILVNLVLNARDAMPQGGKLTIETSNADLGESYRANHAIVPPGKYIMLAVTDNGCGMDRETQSRIFEPFFTTKAVGKGTGLGLATVYGIVKQSGGFIWVYSEPGRGTTFKIYLPRENGPISLPHTHARPITFQRGSETVLLVEDAEPVRALAKEFLTESGYSVLEACDGKEAILLARETKTPIHLLLTDVVMPRMGGRQLAEQLARLHPAIKVLYMSGYPNDGIVRSGVLAGGVAFLQKPFTRELFLLRVREVLDHARKS
jgi:two-component system, cell cycle sensor histidine kinase and response regulator CckA